MKKLFLMPLLSMLLLVSCQNQKRSASPEETASEGIAYSNYGEDFSTQGYLPAQQAKARYETLQPGDTLDISFMAKVTGVCKKKGCWMTLALPEKEQDVMVKFKDYGFFVPKDITNAPVLVKGKAYVTEVSVEEQRHYAEDNGKTAAQIASITRPKRTWSFLADGVKIKQ